MSWYFFRIFLLDLYALLIEEMQIWEGFTIIGIFNWVYVFNYINFIGAKFVNLCKFAF